MLDARIPPAAFAPEDEATPEAPVTPAPTQPRMGDLLLRAGLVTEDQLLDALAAQRDRRKRLGEILREDGVLDEVALAAVLAVQLDTPLVDLRERPSEDAALRALSEGDARRMWVVPLAISGLDHEGLIVATDDPGNQSLLDEVAAIVGRPVDPAALAALGDR